MNNKKIKDHFTKIYDNNTWGQGSGGGSLKRNTVIYNKLYQDFLEENEIKTIIDYGCGDWQSTQFLNFDDVTYLGIDCVDSVISNNINNYSKDNIKFEVVKDNFYSYKADLLVVKDVLQHWTNDEVIDFLDKVLDNYEYILITNSSSQTHDNQDTPYRSRPLSSKYLPLKKYKCEILLEYMGDTPKEVSLIKNKK
jgi:trans-aconitate methyltransferase